MSIIKIGTPHKQSLLKDLEWPYDTFDLFYCTPLPKFIEIIKILIIVYKIDLNNFCPEPSIISHNFLGHACAYGTLDKVVWLMHYPNIHPNKIIGGATALYAAFINNDADKVRYLLTDYRVDPNLQTVDNYPQLLIAFARGWSSMLEVLLTDIRIKIDPECQRSYPDIIAEYKSKKIHLTTIKAFLVACTEGKLRLYTCSMYQIPLGRDKKFCIQLDSDTYARVEIHRCKINKDDS